MPTKLIALTLSLISLLLFPIFYLADVQAVVDNCSVVQKDRSSLANETKTLNFDITNFSSSNIGWVKISAPSGFQITGASASNFSVSISSSNVTFTGGSLAPTSNQNFAVSVTAGNAAQPPSSFGVEAAESGSNPVSCSGNTSVEITSQGIRPTFTSISADNITQSSVTINWTTSAPTTSALTVTLNGVTIQNPTDNTHQTAHSFSLVGLASATVYHYVVSGTDSFNNTITSGDSTFLTLTPDQQATISNAPSTSSSSSSSTSNGKRVRKPKNLPPKPGPKPVPDITAPEIELTTDFSKSYKTPPNLTGTLADENGISELFYSLDNGKNYIPADFSISSFDIKLQDLADGNYKVKIMAKDPSGNIGQSQTSTLVIDILPPKIGPSLINLGPQIISPNPNQITYLLANLDHKISLPVIGGPSKIDLTIAGSTNQTFSLTKNLDTSLWEGALNLSQPGLYQLVAKTVDGMDNQSEKKVNKIYVLESGKIVGQDSIAIKGAAVTLYRYDPILKSFQKWQAEGYDQKNPLNTDQTGSYSLYPPKGKYYLSVTKPGYKEIKSQIFELNQSQPINTTLILEKGTLFNLAFLSSLIDIFRSHPKIVLQTPPDINNTDALKLPLKLAKIDSKSLGLAFDLSNRPKIIISVLNSFSPQTFEQVRILEKISTNRNIEIIALFPLESASKIAILKKRGEYTLDMAADPTGVLIETLNPVSTPSHYFLKQNVLQQVKYGLLTDQDLGDN